VGVGAASAPGSALVYMAFFYEPGGNITGRFADNVLPK